MAAITIGLCDDHHLVRKSMAVLLSSLGTFSIVVNSGSGDEFIQALSALPVLPDILVVDIQMRPRSGWDTLSELKERWPEVRVLMLSWLDAGNIAANLIAYGADGFCSKSSEPEELIAALQAMYEKGTYFPRDIQLQMRQHYRANMKPISPRERIFLTLCVEDKNLAEIADKMNVSPRTVDNYRDSLFGKLQVRTRAGLIMFAIKSGMISPSE